MGKICNAKQNETNTFADRLTTSCVGGNHHHQQISRYKSHLLGDHFPMFHIRNRKHLEQHLRLSEAFPDVHEQQVSQIDLGTQ